MSSKSAADLTRLEARIQARMDEYDRCVNGFSAVDEGARETVRALCTTLEHWILTEYKQEARVSDDIDMKFHDVVISHMLRTIELVVTLEERFNYQASWKQELAIIGQKEVSRGE